MSTGFPYYRSAVEADLQALRRSWGWLLAWGVLVTVAGIVAVGFPVMATVASVQVFGILLIIAAGGQIAGAFMARGWGGVSPNGSRVRWQASGLFFFEQHSELTALGTPPPGADLALALGALSVCYAPDGSWQIARSHVSSSRTGRERSKSWRSGFRLAGAV